MSALGRLPPFDANPQLIEFISWPVTEDRSCYALRSLHAKELQDAISAIAGSGYVRIPKEPALIHGITCMRDLSFFWCADGSASRISHTNDRQLPHPFAQHVLMQIQIAGCLADRYATLLDQPHRLTLELAAECSSRCHAPPPVSSSHLNSVSVKPAAVHIAAIRASIKSQFTVLRERDKVYVVIELSK
jgi:hypothetical protein